MRKVLTIVASVIVTLVIVIGAWVYIDTIPQRRYEAKTRELKRLVERQELELKAYQYAQAFQKIRAQQQKPAGIPIQPKLPVDPNN